jgi:hypothetical protein
MKFNLKKEIHKDRSEGRSIISSMVLNGLSQAVQENFDEILDVYKENDGIVDITLTIEGHEIDVKGFVDFWQSQVRRMIKEPAKMITDEMFGFEEIDELIYDLKDRLQSEINNRLEDWEKELDFGDEDGKLESKELLGQ